MRRKITHTETHRIWRERIERFRKHQGSRSEFCRREGVTLNSLSYWLRKLTDSGLPISRERPQSAFAAVEIVSASCSPHYCSRSEGFNGVHNGLPDPRWTAEFLRHLLGASS